MIHIHLDIETRSRASLTSTTKKVGSDAYSRDASTDVWCVCWYVEDGFDDVVQVWEPGDPIPEIFKEPWICVAHNYRFEQSIIQHVLIPRYGWTAPIDYRCTMARCAAANLPMSLAASTERLGLSPKDKEGHSLMVRMANAARYDPTKEGSAAQKNHEKNIAQLIDYCKQDVLAEADLDRYFTFYDFPLEQFQLDRRINDRGIKVDVQTAAAIDRAIEKETKRLNKELKGLTGGAVSTGKQTAKLLEWLKSQGYPHDGLTEGHVSDAVKCPESLSMEGIQVLDLRRRLALGSLAKYSVMARNVDEQDRLHDLFQFCGASQTGRWAGRLVQIQNLPRLPYDLSDDSIDTLVELFRAGDTKEIIKAFGHDILTVAKWMIRPMFIASKGKHICVSDLAQIEARTLAWLAGQDDVLETFASGGDPYAQMASKIFAKPAEQCGKGTKQRQLGKAAVLGCFAADTQVVTDRGLVPIEQINSADKVWDGDVWVRTDGTIDRGIKGTIEVSGVRVTPDHEYLTAKGWKPACELTEHDLKSAIDLASGKLAKLNWAERSSATSGTAKVRTYDLLNCGPRNRFTIMTDDGPMIVHNCGFGLGANGFEQNVWDMERVRLTPEESQTIVQAYRDASPQIVTFWYGIDTAFRKLVNDPKAAAEVGRLRLHREGDCICIRLPSGRQLRYWQPSLETTQEGKQELRFSAATDHRNKLWRGLLVENIVQATARDVLTDRMLELDRQGLSIVGHVHDEVLIEMDETLDTANVHQIMSTNPGWADSLPLAAETAKGRRYTK